jgi:hypothetical protein
MLEKLANGIRTVDLETVRLAAELLQKAKVMERGTDEKQFRVEVLSSLTPLFIGPEEDAMGMIEEKRCTKFTEKTGRLSRQLAVGNSGLHLLIVFGWRRYRDDDFRLAEGRRRLGAARCETYVGDTGDGCNRGTPEKKAAGN